MFFSVWNVSCIKFIFPIFKDGPKLGDPCGEASHCYEVVDSENNFVGACKDNVCVCDSGYTQIGDICSK